MKTLLISCQQSTLRHSREGPCIVVEAVLIYDTNPLLISCQLTANKALERGCSFCSWSRPYLQNENPIDFASFGVGRKALTRFDCLWFDRLVKKNKTKQKQNKTKKKLVLVFGSSFLGLKSLFCRRPVVNSHYCFA